MDLIFTSNPSFISASGLELSLYEKCHHKLIYGINLWNSLHEIHSSFDCDPTIDVSEVFLDISKAFDKVWHEEILFNLILAWALPERTTE